MSQPLDINAHPIWKNISSFKKPLHLIRIHLARQMARLYPRSAFIGITGSVGKTSTAIACQAVLSLKYPTLVTQGNLDPILNIPITLLKMTPKYKKVILEMGIEYPGEMDFYLSIVAPSTAVVTRIFYAHSEFLGDLESIVEEKGRLVAQLPKEGLAVLNWDDLNTRKLSEKTDAEVIFYGTSAKNCHVWAGNVRIESFKTVFELNYGVERVEVVLPYLGKHWVTSALAAAALGVSSGISLINIKNGLESIKSPEHRLQVKEGLNNTIVLDDTYNSSPVALEEALNLLNEIEGRRRIIVLGEMRELGPFTEQLHRRIAQKIFKDKTVDMVLLAGGSTSYIADELINLGFPKERVEQDLSNSQIVSKILKSTKKGDVILVKASRSIKLDEVVDRITKR